MSAVLIRVCETASRLLAIAALAKRFFHSFRLHGYIVAATLASLVLRLHLLFVVSNADSGQLKMPGSMVCSPEQMFIGLAPLKMNLQASQEAVANASFVLGRMVGDLSLSKWKQWKPMILIFCTIKQKENIKSRKIRKIEHRTRKIFSAILWNQHVSTPVVGTFECAKVHWSPLGHLRPSPGTFSARVACTKSAACLVVRSTCMESSVSKRGASINWNSCSKIKSVFHQASCPSSE